MASMVKKIMPVSRSVSSREYVDVSFEYSIASEYKGLPVGYDLPKAVPVEVDRIPIAKVAASAALLNNLSLPVVQPVAKSNKRHSKRVGLGSTGRDFVNSLAQLGTRYRDSDNHASSGEYGGGSGAPVDTLEDGECSVDQSGFVGGKAAVFSENVDDCLDKLPDGTDSSGTLRFSDSHDHSYELSGSSDMRATPINYDEIEDFGNRRNPANGNSTEPSLTPQAVSAEICSEGEVWDDEADLQHGKRKSAVTFLNPKSFEVDLEEPMQAEKEVIQERRVPDRKIKKGLCHRCLKGNRVTEKEACIVCDAKYCSNCVLRAMGSMPEGRKCLTCIGIPIAESKKRVLGKCSRMLRRLLCESQVKQIMNAEISCAVNQLVAEICVNGKPLCQEELMSLLKCPCPPRNLKHGNYWYDKVSGFWGKEGHKPCQIISPQLNVGGPIKRDASNGNTNVLINNREITKVELLMLQWAGVQCAGISSLWVNADGSYVEEGMDIVKGNIWGKKRAKLVCTLLSLPTPESANPGDEQLHHGIDGPEARYPEQRELHKLLLVGNDQSGTSTIFKQARIIYNVPFSGEERQNIKFMIQSNLYAYLAVLLAGLNQFEEEWLMKMTERQSTDQPGFSGTTSKDNENIYSIGPKLKAFANWLVDVMVSGNLDVIFPAAAREYARYVEELWKDAAIQATYSRRNELELPTVASYFLERATEIAKVDYEPSDTDILHAEGITSSNGLTYMNFSFRGESPYGWIDPTDGREALAQYQLVRVHAKSFGENCRWLEMFEDAAIVLFCVSLTDYAEYEADNMGVFTNKMLASRRLFESIVSHPTFEGIHFLLILDKFDILEEKIEQVPLTQCEWFHDFNPVLSRHHSNNSNANNMPTLAQRAFHYVAVKFKRLFKELTGRKLYAYPVISLKPDTVDGALRYAREIIRWEEEKFSLNGNELSSESISA
ncbi:hypothetical protein Nepgr_025398 [Nepenthes gracilis]|uniref:Extra-large guanine nucleotide-binding protein 1-like n=1 Tax=Nepenthes gracilis TaxID=150966 RepID=A0AAD3T516_NEPGR|nr:hypothetical protein Nepgr_025398 [Nepenthes gracilis]